MKRGRRKRHVFGRERKECWEEAVLTACSAVACGGRDFERRVREEREAETEEGRREREIVCVCRLLERRGEEVDIRV